ncbi:MAG: RecX family transcriptional regulator [Balneolaceae bacterium]|nr:RecX family transcriptional regulator [Balneolaceae bacterium]
MTPGRDKEKKSDANRDITRKLPAKITSIRPQKNNKDRYSLFIDGAFVIGIAESTLLEFQIEEGMELTPYLLNRLQQAEGREAVRTYCLRMLARRDHSRKELFDKARKKDHPADLVEGVLDELEEKGYLDDRTFARTFASDKSRLNNWGPAKIKAHLFKKGIPESIADEGIDAAFEELDLKETLFDLVKKKKRRFRREEDLFRRKKKIFDYLYRKGYRSESIFRVLDELAASVEESEFG